MILVFKFKNHGLGPAIFSDVKITLNAEAFDMSVEDPVEQLVSAVLGRAFKYNVVQSTTIPRGMVVPSQQEVKVVEIHLPEVRKDYQKEFMALFDRVELKVVYRSMYGKRFVLETADKGPPHLLKKLWHCTKTFFAWLF